MRTLHLPRLVICSACLLAGAASLAQAPASPTEVAATVDESPPRVEQRVQRIRVEDRGSRVDEVRVGGQTKSITVQSKANVPEYEITPTDGTRAVPAPRQGAETGTGPRVWNVMKF